MAWFFLGFLFGIVAIIVLYFLGEVESELAPLKTEEVIEVPFNVDLQWYYLDVDWKQQGPVTLEQLCDSWKEKRLVPSSLVWNSDLVHWTPVEEQSALYHYLMKRESQG